VRVEKDERFVRDMIDEVKAVWDKVLEFRRDPEAFRRYLSCPAPRSGANSAPDKRRSQPQQQEAKGGYAFVGLDDD